MSTGEGSLSDSGVFCFTLYPHTPYPMPFTYARYIMPRTRYFIPLAESYLFLNIATRIASRKCTS
jgi:hypothetical protein